MSRKTVNNGIDVRTNMLALLVINTLVLTGKGGMFQLACVAVICLLLMLQRRRLAAGLLALCVCVIQLLPPVMPVLSAALLYARPYLIAGFMGYYFICATTPSLLIAGLHRLHLPGAAIIPLAVMLRFFPVLKEEAKAIRGAMRMRGIPGSGGILLHPWRTLEYFLVPLIASMLRSAEALSAVALSRGLGSPGVSSSILSLRWSVRDVLLGAVCVGLVVLFFYCEGA